jgi:sensor histidine kinase YesM
VIVLVIAILLCVSKRLKQAQQDKLDAELSYLKAQINPHFLFNTLNSIYSLAITRSELTAAAVLKLSEMMRYVTTEAHSELVLLEKEINYVSNYIELQRIRLGKTVRIDYQTTGTSGQKRIAPLVLIPFVENAFKYGVNPEEESVVTIRITITAQKLTMFVGNKIVKIDVLDEYKSGHGMDNVSQRLQIGYPGKHKLNVSREGDEYHVNLELDL